MPFPHLFYKCSHLSSTPVILIAPLDWGLGHTTRCIPLIHQLVQNGCRIIIAAEGAGQQLLQQEFPQAVFIARKGYRVQYAQHKKLLPLKLLLQLPRIVYRIWEEHRWLKKVVKEFGVDGIISDNRPGLFHAAIPSVYITHQLSIQTGNAFTAAIANAIHHWFIKKFTQCWVPDFEGDNSIAGALSKSKKQLPLGQFIGGLSRFDRLAEMPLKYDLLLLLSGPEPQRSIFENILLSQLKSFSGRVLLVRGLPNSSDEVSVRVKKGKVDIKNHLSASALNEAIQQAKLVVCRSGYTSVMDLIKLQQPAILVPTPGQPEQEYLGQYLHQKQIFYSVEQQQFLLEKAIAQALPMKPIAALQDMERYKKTVDQWVSHLIKAV